MALLKSISGIRGTIGGVTGENLTPLDIVRFAAAYGTWLLETSPKPRVVVGRDGRISGQMVQELVVQTLLGLGIHVIDAGLSTTPTVEMAVVWEKADGGIIITASHNPGEWNALKLLNRQGEFIDAATGNRLLEIAEAENFQFASVDQLGTCKAGAQYFERHIQAVVNYPLVNVPQIRKKQYRVVVDVINSTGALVIPQLLKALGAEEVIVLHGEVTGKFAHLPEPLPENLQALSQAVVHEKADFGIAVDPDVDRLCFVCEDGSMFGEEFTLVAVADYVLSKRLGNTVSNLSSTKALREITLQRGGQYFPSSVGEVNVVSRMKEVQAVIGGEGNGGIIVPDLHYGRDALIGIGLFCTAFSAHDKSLRAFRKQYPDYHITKNKIALNPGWDVAALLSQVRKKYPQWPVNTEDGLRIEFEEGWVHLRPSNTEPIIRIYAESASAKEADQLAGQLMQDLRDFVS
ncbi:MAG: phosphoglucosamine mutase [Chitinophagaceae bacterium]